MESRISRIFLNVVTCLLMAFVGVCYADTSSKQVGAAPIIEPFVLRADLNEADIDTGNFEIGVYVGLLSMEELTSTVLFGVSATFHATEDIFLEANYAISTIEEPHSSQLNQSDLFTDDELTMYDLSLGLNVLPGEVFVGESRAYNSALYIIAGAGITQLDKSNELTLIAGLGYRMIITDWLALHVDFRDRIFEREIGTGPDKITFRSHNLDFHAGVSYFF
ncbi:MAG: outer membrane beta-barrel domain-containing protein [Moraxellaceae bacterium]|nr:MAG: outer membrane beta-barrel domain-containing protein [Moraxellaceae bacterium]